MTNGQKLPELSKDTIDKLEYLKTIDLPDFYQYVLSLRKNKWPLRAIAEPLGVSRSIVSVWEKKAIDVDLPDTEQLPPSLPKEMKPVYSKYILQPEKIKELRKLAKSASKVRRYTDENALSRVSAIKLENLLREYKDEGASLSQLANACGVSRRAIAQRLEKHAE